MECLQNISITLAGLSLGRSSLQFPRIKSLWSSSSCVTNVFESLQFVERFFLRGGREDRFQFDAAAKEDSFLVAFRPLLATRSTRSLPMHLYASLAPTWSRSASIFLSLLVTSINQAATTTSLHFLPCPPRTSLPVTSAPGDIPDSPTNRSWTTFVHG